MAFDSFTFQHFLVPFGTFQDSVLCSTLKYFLLIKVMQNNFWQFQSHLLIILILSSHNMIIILRQAHSVAASQVEKTLSEVASSLSTGLPKHGPHDSAYAQIRWH